MNTRPLMIVVTGPDGSGKSTACANVCALLTRRLGLGSALEVSVWDCLKEQSGVSPAFKSQADAARYLGDLDGTSRTLFIFHAMARALGLALRTRPRVVLLSGYWYKYAVSEIGYGMDADFVMGAASGFARPDHVFSLDIDPATAWDRRLAATLYEQGGSAATGASDRERFLGFQAKLQKVWAGLEAQSGLDWEHLSALDPASEIASRICEGVLLRLPKGEGRS